MAIGLSGIGSGWDEPEPNGGGAGGGGSTVVVGAAKSDEELALDLEKSAEKLRSDLISQMCSVSNIDSPIFVPATCASGLVTARRLRVVSSHSPNLLCACHTCLAPVARQAVGAAAGCTR